MNESGRASWTAHLGDLPATVTGPAQWVRAQRDILGHFLAGPIGDHELEPIRLDVTFDDHLVHLLTAAAEERPGARLLETTPGVVMVEYPDGPSRVLTIATDKIDDSPGTHALRITDEHIELVIHSNSNRTDRLPLRVLREAMIRRYENAGATLIHAAGGAFGSAGIAVCGPRAAGKTTTLSHSG